jgi:hypothetical protein
MQDHEGGTKSTMHSNKNRFINCPELKLGAIDVETHWALAQRRVAQYKFIGSCDLHAWQ